MKKKKTDFKYLQTGKTKLYLTVKNNNVYFTPVNYKKVIREIIDKKTGQPKQIVTKNTFKLADCFLFGGLDNIPNKTDYFVSVCDKYMPLFVYQALKTIYCNYPTEKIRLLMNDCIELQKKQLSKQELYEQSLSIGNNIVLVRMKKYSARELALQIRLANRKQTSYNIIHKYKMLADSTGKKHRIECIPYTETKKSLYQVEKEDKKQSRLNSIVSCEDLMQIGFESMIYLCNIGLVKDLNSFWNYRQFVYKSINSAVMNERKISLQYEDYIQVMHSLKITTKDIDQAEKRMMYYHLFDILKLYLNDLIVSKPQYYNFDNCNKILLAYVLIFITALDYETIGRYLKVRKNQVTRYKKQIVKIFLKCDNENNHYIHKFLLEMLAS